MLKGIELTKDSPVSEYKRQQRDTQLIGLHSIDGLKILDGKRAFSQLIYKIIINMDNRFFLNLLTIFQL